MASARKAWPAARATFYKALTQPGAVRHSTYEVEANFAGNCTEPKLVQNTGRSYETPSGDTRAPYTATMWVRCRKCQACRSSDAYHWQIRAGREIDAAPRTWFVTITFRMETHWLLEQQAMKQGRKHFDLAYREVQLAFKRARKRGLKLRYLLATEAHESGYPHFHLLVHEEVYGQITSRYLSGNQKENKSSEFWPHGIVHCRLLDKANPYKAAGYVTKYIWKEDNGRVKASLKYGGGRKGGL